MCYDLNLYSDHYPVMINVKINKKYITNELKLKTYDFSRANWSKFTNILEQAELSEAYLLNDIILCTNINFSLIKFSPNHI